MYVHIVHCRDQQFVAEVRHRNILKGVGQLLIHACYLTAVNGNITVLDDLKLRAFFCEENVCFIDFHDIKFLPFDFCLSAKVANSPAKVLKKNDICKYSCKNIGFF